MGKHINKEEPRLDPKFNLFIFFLKKAYLSLSITPKVMSNYTLGTLNR